MGKIESGEIGEVDPLPDSGNSLALIRYAKRAASSHSPQHAERGGSLRGGQRKPIGSSACPAPSSGHPKGISGDSVLFSAHICFADVFAASVKASEGNAFWDPHKQGDGRVFRKVGSVYDSGEWLGITMRFFRDGGCREETSRWGFTQSCVWAALGCEPRLLVGAFFWRENFAPEFSPLLVGVEEMFVGDGVRRLLLLWSAALAWRVAAVTSAGNQSMCCQR